VPVVVVGVGAYLVSGILNRRFNTALRELEAVTFSGENRWKR
jgi:hypothetical protein